MMSQYSDSQREAPTIGIDGANGDHHEQPTVNTETNFNTIDCWIYEGIANNNLTNGTVSGSGIDAWLKTPVPSNNGQQPMAGLRLIIGSQTANQKLPFTETHLQHLVKDVSLQNLIYKAMQGSIGVTARLCSEGLDLVFVVVENLKGIVCIVLHFHAAANITTGFIIASAETNVGETMKGISSAFLACHHLLVVPVTLCEDSLSAVRTRLDEVHEKLSTREVKLNKEDDIERAWGNCAGDLKVIVGLVNNLASAKDGFRSIKLATNFVREQLKQLQIMSRGKRRDEGRQSGGIARKCLENRLAVLSSTLVHLDSFKSLERRLQSQLELLTSLEAINYRKQNAMMTATKDAGEGTDKLIALLTILFVPSTFVATFLTMPLFDWSAPSDQIIVQNRLWIYWAVTAPLMVLILIPTLWWYRLRRKMWGARTVARNSSEERF